MATQQSTHDIPFYGTISASNTAIGGGGNAYGPIGSGGYGGAPQWGIQPTIQTFPMDSSGTFQDLLQQSGLDHVQAIRERLRQAIGLFADDSSEGADSQTLAALFEEVNLLQEEMRAIDALYIKVMAALVESVDAMDA